jgi:ectoine hydroxylase-related dioxygenase (phytanoyl-CoA dioxygenase family)
VTDTHQTGRLSGQQVAFFQDNGYLDTDTLFDPSDLEKIDRICIRLIEQKAGREEGDQFDLAGPDDDPKKAALPQIMNPSKYAPELAKSPVREAAKAIAEQLLGPGVELVNEHMIRKPPRHGAATPWHQDQAYHKPDMIYDNVNIWIPLRDATIENGCMQYVPGSQKITDVLPHHSIGNDPRAGGLEVDDPEQYNKQAVPCPVPVGGATMHRSYTLHYAGPNNTDSPRPAYILVYGHKPKKRDTPLNFPWQTNHHDGKRG